MFHDMPPEIARRMRALEEIDARDRRDGTPRSRRLRQVSPEVGRFIALMAAAAPAGRMIEVGTSGGYSTQWLALACRATGRSITTFEISEEKAAIARETFAVAGLADVVELVVGDALPRLAACDGVAFCFLDAEKEVYGPCYEEVVPRLVAGGILVADNATSHQEALKPMLDRALADPRVDALVVPIGRGELVCRKR